MTHPVHPSIALLLQAYRATLYRVWAPGQQLLLRVGQYDPGLAKVMREAWVEGAGLLTAWNPGSRPRDRASNQAAQQQLLDELAAAGHPCLPARNEPDGATSADRQWTEESVLALDLTPDAARALALRYGQVAFLWIDARATPQLLLAAAGEG